MKYIVLLLIIPGAAIPSSRAQLIQLSGGIGLSGNRGGNSYEFTTGNMKVGYRVGATADFIIKRSVCFQPGLFFCRLGSFFPGSNIPVNNEDAFGPRKSLPLSYVQVPLLVTYRVQLTSAKGIRLGIGPCFGFLINSPKKKFMLEQNANHVRGILVTASDADQPVYKRTDWGLCYGAALEIYKAFNISAQYYYGIRNIIKYDDQLELSNHAFSVSIEYYINRRQFIRKYFGIKK